MQNAEKYIYPIKWTYSEITTADERGEAYGCLDLVPFSDVHYYATENHDEAIVYQPDPDAFSTPWSCDIYDSEGCTVVAGAQGQTMEEAFENAIIEFCVINARETEKDAEDVINVATAQAFAALNNGMYPDDSDPREVWEALEAIRDKVMELESMPDESDPYGIAAQFEREQNAQNAARVMNSLATAARYAEAMSAPDTHASITQELQTLAARLTREGYRVDYVEAIDLWTVHA